MAQQSEKIEQFSILLKGVRGPGLEDIVAKALSEPGLFVFGELVALPNVQQLRGTDYEIIVRTLELFAFGTFMDYKANHSTFLVLDARQELKLKQLTMCTLAKRKRIPYAELMEGLQLTSIRVLEDFVIQDCVYPGLLKCKLDQVQRCIHVQEVFKRDVRPEKLPALTEGLAQMLSWVELMMSDLDTNVDKMAVAHAEQSAADEAFQEKLDAAKLSIERMESIQQEDQMSAEDKESAAVSLLHLSGSRHAGPARVGRGGHRNTMPDAKRRR